MCINTASTNIIDIAILLKFKIIKEVCIIQISHIVRIVSFLYMELSIANIKESSDKESNKDVTYFIIMVFTSTTLVSK